MKIAVAQISSILGGFWENIRKHVSLCKKAAAAKCSVIVFPELSLTGYSLKDINYDVAVNPYKSDKLKELIGVSRKIDVVAGFVEEDDRYAIYNSSIYLSKGRIAHIHRKIYPPTYTLFEEFRYFSAGTECSAFDTGRIRSGMLVCEDLWHLSLPYLLAADGAQLIYGLAASPTRLNVNTDKFRNYEINSEQHRTFARLLSVYLVFSNRVGYEDGINFWGGSEIINPFGDVVASAGLFEEEFLFANIDFAEVRRARMLARHFLDEKKGLMYNNLRRIIKK